MSNVKFLIKFCFISDEERHFSVTYEDLKNQCEIIQALIATASIIGDSVVGIYCQSGPAVVACMIGLLVKNPFIYLSADLKENELRKLIMRVPILNLIIDKDLYFKFQSINSVIMKEFLIFNKTYLLLHLTSTNTYQNQEILSSNSLAYVMCTSGSTNLPKLVYVPHSCIVPNIQDFKNIFNISHNDTILNLSPLYFDPSIVDIFLALSYGAHLIMLAPRLVKRPKALEMILENNKVSVIQITPVLMCSLNSSFLRLYFLSIKAPRIIAFGGEMFPSPSQCGEWFAPHCQTRVFNLYGLTELSCWASCHEINICDYVNLKGSQIFSAPLGLPLTGTTIYLSDDLGNKVKKGNIMIGGERNICYILDQEENHTFINKDIVTGDIGYTDGIHIFYLERTCNTVKRNGCRISLHEIEGAVKLLPEVNCCCSVFDQNQIYLFVVQPQFTTLSKEILWSHLEKCLSKWKLPDKIYIIEKLPTNRNGKVDKQELVERVRQYSSSVKHDKKENIYEIMRDLWKNYLEGCSPKNGDNFVTLGGDSLKAIQLAEKIVNLYDTENSLILQTLLNDTFEDVCKLIYNDKATLSSSLSSNSSLTEPNLKRKHENVESTRKKISINGNHLYHINKSGSYRNGQRVITSSLNIKSINLEWNISLEKCIDASPLLTQLNSEIRIFIGSHSHKFVCVDESGTEIWTTELPDRIEASASSSPDGKNVYIGCYDGNLYCLDAYNGKTLWKFATEGIIKSSPAIDDDLIVFGSYNKHLYCLNFKGEIRWKKAVSNGSIFSSPSILQNCIYTATLDGFVVCLDTNGSVIWKKFIGKPIFSSLAVFSGGIVFGCTDHFIYCLDLDSNILWKHETSAPIFSSPFILEYESTVLITIGSYDNFVYLFNQTGRLIASFELSSPIFSSPFSVICKEELTLYTFFCETKGCIHLLSISLNSNDAQVYKSLQTYKVNGEIYSSPIFHKNKLYVGCRNDYLYCLTIT